MPKFEFDIQNLLALKVFEYNGEGNFGELALLYNQPRAATVQVSLTQKVWQK